MSKSKRIICILFAMRRYSHFIVSVLLGRPCRVCLTGWKSDLLLEGASYTSIIFTRLLQHCEIQKLYYGFSLWELPLSERDQSGWDELICVVFKTALRAGRRDWTDRPRAAAGRLEGDSISISRHVYDDDTQNALQRRRWIAITVAKDGPTSYCNFQTIEWLWNTRCTSKL